MRRYFLVLIFLTIVYCAKGQTEKCGCFVKGVVLDQHTHQPIAGASVSIIGKNEVAFTSARGEYQLRNLCPGTYDLECRILGYGPFRLKVDLTSGHEENFNLLEQEVHLMDVEITAHRSDAPGSQPHNILTEQELSQTRGQTLAQSLSGITGVTTLQTGASIAKPVIHGMHSNRVLVMNNGVRQEGQQWGSEHAPEIDPFVATKLSVVKGAASVRYGSDAIGGVVLVEPEELPFYKALAGEVNLVGFSNGRQGVASATLEGSIKKMAGFGWRAQGTLKRSGNTRTPGYFLDNTGFSEKNFSLSAGYRKKGFGIDLFYSRFDTQIGIFSGSHIGSLSDLLSVIQSGEPYVKSGFSYQINRPQQNVNHHLLKAETHYHFASGHRLQWTVAQQLNSRNEYDLHRSRNDSIAALNHPELTFRLNTLTNDLIWDHKPWAKKIAGQVGISTLYQYNLMDGRPLIPNFNQFNIGLFWIERYAKNGWEAEAGARYDYRTLKTYRIVNRRQVSSPFEFAHFSGTIGISKALSERLSAKFNLGSAWRAPNVSELFSDGVHHGAAAFERGDSTLSMEKALNTIASINYTSDRFSVELGTYFNYIANYIYLKPQPEPILTVRGAFPYFVYSQTNATFKGVDLSVAWTMYKGLTLTTKLSQLSAYDQGNKGFLVMIPSNRVDNQLKYAFRSAGKREESYISLNNLLVAQQKRVPPGGDFAESPKGYSLWNIQAGTQIHCGEKNIIEIGFAVQNLLNASYRDYMNRFRYYSDDAGRNVSVRLKWKWKA
jgi:iron complex outermembrane recepter protein